ncbi:uncharacterized protein BO72DRAFT_453758 [Aspergillus fijiensis CBS 313.89]|uniref:Uncharacterized protein n=1 Tax=Aspergillus fijiensis CBS 313.89 TaxID=1448319 RepID=A0A8G1RDM4_9EURO|nr:uncharacterized protein BO72DRAFT_453758 [Aspergillus fijiensis CBS 313.89]RAK71364.1 hypothetical protein BO72DRAFT_453758 [Aspergillus fijiensis CBS 313.89]
MEKLLERTTRVGVIQIIFPLSLCTSAPLQRTDHPRSQIASSNFGYYTSMMPDCFHATDSCLNERFNDCHRAPEPTQLPQRD